MIWMKTTIMTMKTNTITMVIETKKQDTASFTKGFLDRMSGPLVQVYTIEALISYISKIWFRYIVIVTISDQYTVTLSDQTIHLDFRVIAKTTVWARQCARKTMSTGESNNLASLSTKGGTFSFPGTELELNWKSKSYGILPQAGAKSSLLNKRGCRWSQ